MKRIGIFAVIIMSLFSVSFMTVSPVLADDYTTPLVENRKGWELMREFIETLTGAVGENIEQLVAKFIYGTADVALGVVAPGVTEAADDLGNSNLPDSMKYGLAGMAEEQLLTMYQEYPDVEVGEHLAQEWVPGYSSESSVLANGYEDLRSTGIVQFWNKTRNLAYLCYVVIFIGIGFMIMFRHKLGGQTMVTLGNSLPNIIISLLLVTFSFAIAGLIIDIGGMLLNIIADLIYENPAAEAIAVHNPWALGLDAILSPATEWIGGSISIVSAIAGMLIFMNPAGGLIGIVIALVVACFVVWGAIKLLISLVKSYLGILINVIVAPLQLMMGAMPGNSAAIGNWLKSIARNVLVFPVSFAIVNLPMAIATGMENEVGWNGFPDALVWGDASDGGLQLGVFILSLIKVFAIYFAASTPEYLKALIPATQSKSMAEFAGAVKGGMSKIPLVGGMFK